MWERAVFWGWEWSQNPVDVTFSITVVSGASRAVAGAGWLMAAILATIFASACC